MTGKLPAKPVSKALFTSTRLTPAEIDALRADKKATLARLREIRAARKAKETSR